MARCLRLPTAAKNWATSSRLRTTGSFLGVLAQTTPSSTHRPLEGGAVEEAEGGAGLVEGGPGGASARRGGAGRRGCGRARGARARCRSGGRRRRRDRRRSRWCESRGYGGACPRSCGGATGSCEAPWRVNGSGSDGPVHDAATEPCRGTREPRGRWREAGVTRRAKAMGWERGSGIEPSPTPAHREAV